MPWNPSAILTSSSKYILAISDKFSGSKINTNAFSVELTSTGLATEMMTPSKESVFPGSRTKIGSEGEKPGFRQIQRSPVEIFECWNNFF